MIAAAIFAALVIVVSRSQVSIQNVVEKVNINLTCNQRAANILNVFKNNMSQTNVSNWHPFDLSGLVPPQSAMTGLSTNQANVRLFPTPLPTNLNNLSVNPWLLIDNSVNWALNLYNTGAYCRAPVLIYSRPATAATPAPTLVPLFSSGALRLPPSNIAGEQVFLRIERIDTRTGAVDCGQQGSLAIPPLSVANNSTSRYGLKLSVEVKYSGKENVNCEVDTVLMHQPRQATATLVSTVGTPVDVFSGNCPNAADPTTCYCTAGNKACLVSACAGVGCSPTNHLKMGNPLGNNPVICSASAATVKIALVSSQPGTLFSCRLDSATWGNAVTVGSTFSSCANIPTTGGTGHVSLTTFGTSEARSGAQIVLPDLPPGNYIFSAKAVDIGQAYSPVEQVAFTIVDPCPYAITDLVCPSVPLNDLCGNVNACVGTMPIACPDPATRVCGPIVDPCGRACTATGALLNPAQCNPAAVPCGNPVVDSCGHSCGSVGTGLNTSQCLPPGCADCHTTISDQCGNACWTGTGPGSCGPGFGFIGPMCDDCGFNACSGSCVNPPLPTPATCTVSTCFGGPAPTLPAACAAPTPTPVPTFTPAPTPTPWPTLTPTPTPRAFCPCVCYVNGYQSCCGSCGGPSGPRPTVSM